MDDESSNEPPVEKGTCSMCHREVPLQEIIVFSGRQLCFGCAGAWFEEDEEEN